VIRRITAKTKVLGYAALTDVNLAGDAEVGPKGLIGARSGVHGGLERALGHLPRKMNFLPEMAFW